MSGGKPTEWIVVTENARTLPAIELLTGRGFITGKSGSGKSNTCSVIAEELLEGGFNLLIVDTEGEYFGLKERYDLLHVGANEDECDVAVEAKHAGKIATIALERNLPVILNVSGYDDLDTAKELIHDVVENVYEKERDLRKPFLLVVEEIQEYLPQTGGKDDLAKLLLRVAKRGRKRGLGLCGVSQRPSAVDKDFITQCDWMVWHRLSWETDLDVVSKILGSETADIIPELDDGEAYLMTDWDDEVERVQFRRKKTFDAGATPGLQEYERPDLRSVGEELIGEIKADSAELKGLLNEGPADHGNVDRGGEPEQRSDELDIDLIPRPGREGSDGVSVADSHPVTADELSLVIGPDEDVDLDEASPEELREAIRAERKKNSILESEVKELKRLLNRVDANAAATKRDDGDNDPVSKMIRDEPREDGVAGAVFEIGLLITYVTYKVGRATRRAGASVARAVESQRRRRGHTPAAYPIESGGGEVTITVNQLVAGLVLLVLSLIVVTALVMAA